MKAPIAVALDAPDADTAARWAQAVTPHVAVVKVGLELFCRTGPVDRRAACAGRPAPSCSSTSSCTTSPTPSPVPPARSPRLQPRYLTVHAAGGADMVRAAVEAAPDVTIAAVTVLTS